MELAVKRRKLVSRWVQPRTSTFMLTAEWGARDRKRGMTNLARGACSCSDLTGRFQMGNSTASLAGHQDNP